MLLGKKQYTKMSRPQMISEKSPTAYVEAYKDLRTNFKFAALNGKKRKIIITSTLQNEGKSSVAVNLALALAQTGSRVLLVDGDLRNPSLHRYLGMSAAGYGLSSLLSGGCCVGDCLLKSQYGFDVIPGGPVPPNPAELIGCENMKNLLDVAAANYDYVLCDTPPVGVITDAAALSPLCDGVLFVIRQGMASKNQVREAVQKLTLVDAQIIGTVMNQYDISQSESKDYTYYKPAVNNDD